MTIKGTRIHTVCIEGPDLSGKSTLYNDIHKLSKYKWNIQDRAEVSMFCFSKYYDRKDSERWHKEVQNRLCDLNHRFVFLLPTWQMLSERFNERGDEIHTINSLKETYDMFDSVFHALKEHPNVYMANVTKENQGQIASDVVEWLNDSENQTTVEIAKRVAEVAKYFDNEALGVTFDYYLGDYENVDSSVLEYKPEKEYYSKIRSKFLTKISKEIAGDNEYSKVQVPSNTRRFVYADDSCISMINILVRGSTLNAYAVLRSSNTVDTLSYDLRFLEHLIMEAEDYMSCSFIENRRMTVNIHSAHVINKSTF